MSLTMIVTGTVDPLGKTGSPASVQPDNPRTANPAIAKNKAKNLRMLFSLLVMGSFLDHGLANFLDTI